MAKSELEETLAYQLKVCGFPKPEREYRFSETRRFRADFAFCAPYRVLVEIQGGIFRPKSGHRSVTGLLRDYSKNNLAQLEGWIYLQYSEKEINSGEAINQIEEALKLRGWR